MALEKTTSIDEGVSEIVSILRGMGTDFERAVLDKLIQERFPITSEMERRLFVEVILLRLEKERNIQEVSSLQEQVSTQTEKLVSLSHIAMLDKHSGLPNYESFISDLLIDKPRSLVLFHINDMYRVNNQFSRDTGDMVIQKIGKMLKKYAMDYPEGSVSVYRFDGTTFAIVFHNEVSREHIEEQYERVKSIQIQDRDSGKVISLSFSVGVMLGGLNIHSLIHHAEEALKRSRRFKQMSFYDGEVTSVDSTTDLFAMRKLVNQAFEKDLFTVHVQEIHRNQSCSHKNEPRKFECLVRMYDSEARDKLISPAEFLPVIKKDGKNIDLTTVIIEKVCQMMVQDNHHYCINVTEDDIRLEGGAMKIYEHLARHNIDPSRMTLEILEDVEEIDLTDIQDNIAILGAIGFGIAIDDFGTGRSNFFRLTDIKITSIKIDMQFIQGIDQETEKAQKNRTLIEFVIGYAHKSGLTVVAEGIETSGEQLVVTTLGADYSQGYYFSRPRPYESI